MSLSNSSNSLEPNPTDWSIKSEKEPSSESSLSFGNKSSFSDNFLLDDNLLVDEESTTDELMDEPPTQLETPPPSPPFDANLVEWDVGPEEELPFDSPSSFEVEPEIEQLAPPFLHEGPPLFDEYSALSTLKSDTVELPPFSKPKANPALFSDITTETTPTSISVSNQVAGDLVHNATYAGWVNNSYAPAGITFRAVSYPIPIEEEKKASWILMRELLETIVPALIIALLINLFLAQATRVEGQSMEPNLHTAQRLVVEKLSYKFHPPHRGDIVVLKVRDDSKELLIKRVIALPGETVEVRDGQVFVNEIPLDEPYLNQKTRGRYGPKQIPIDHVFVLGDNRGASNDSRSFGPIELDNIIGRAWLSYWPVEEMGLVE